MKKVKTVLMDMPKDDYELNVPNSAQIIGVQILNDKTAWCTYVEEPEIEKKEAKRIT